MQCSRQIARWLALALIVGWTVEPAAFGSQELPVRPPAPWLAPGQVLVATPKSRDPELSRTVILIVQQDSNGVVGLVLNHPSDVSIGKLFPQSPNMGPGRAAVAGEPVLTGGPVNIGVRGLVRSTSQPGGAVHVFADVYLFSGGAALEKTLASAGQGAQVRVYAGYTGWSLQQLRDEVALGWWNVSPGDPRTVFDRNPERMWTRLSKNPR